MNIQSFPIESLAQYTEQEAALLSRLARLCQSKQIHSLVAQLDPLFQKYLGTLPPIQYEGLSETNYGEFVAGLSENFVCFLVSLTPLSRKVIIELDPEISLALVDKLLGGTGEVIRGGSSITSLEEGVLQFFVIKIIKTLSESLHNASLKLRLDKRVVETQTLKSLEEENSKVMWINFQVDFRQVKGFIRFGFPTALLKELFVKAEIGMNGSQWDEEKFFEERFNNLSSLKVPVWAEVGRVNLSESEFSHLETGDIILLDEVLPSFDGKVLSGEMRLNLGDGSLGALRTELIEAQGQKLKLKLEDVL